MQPVHRKSISVYEHRIVSKLCMPFTNVQPFIWRQPSLTVVRLLRSESSSVRWPSCRYEPLSLSAKEKVQAKFYQGRLSTAHWACDFRMVDSRQTGEDTQNTLWSVSSRRFLFSFCLYPVYSPLTRLPRVPPLSGGSTATYQMRATHSGPAGASSFARHWPLVCSTAAVNPYSVVRPVA